MVMKNLISRLHLIIRAYTAAISAKYQGAVLTEIRGAASATFSFVLASRHLVQLVVGQRHPGLPDDLACFFFAFSLFNLFLQIASKFHDLFSLLLSIKQVRECEAIKQNNINIQSKIP